MACQEGLSLPETVGCARCMWPCLLAQHSVHSLVCVPKHVGEFAFGAGDLFKWDLLTCSSELYSSLSILQVPLDALYSGLLRAGFQMACEHTVSIHHETKTENDAAHVCVGCCFFFSAGAFATWVSYAASVCLALLFVRQLECVIIHILLGPRLGYAS